MPRSHLRDLNRCVWPAALACFAALCPAAGAAPARPAAVVEIPAHIVHDKIRGGLLGEMLGDLNGLAHEMKYIAEPGNVERYTPALPDGAWTDDDTDIEWVYVVEMQRRSAILLSPREIVEAWHRHINRRIWCSNQYVRELMELGIEPPLTGDAELNPWADFNLSGQFLSETWGLIAPGMPQTAAHIALHYTRVGIDGEPAQSTQLFAAMISQAFLSADLAEILDAETAAVDPKSVMRRIVVDVRAWYRENPSDWRRTRRLIQQKYSRYGGAMTDRNGVELNGAATIAALLYGRGDFVETVRHAFNFGWDCDNNAAASGTILGVIKGYRWMTSQGWNITDRFRNTSRDNMPEDETISSFGDRLVALADRVILEHGGSVGQTPRGRVCRIRKENARNFEPLPDPSRQAAELRANWVPEIEAAIAEAADTQRLARAAYLAICLDLAPGLRQRRQERWARAVAALREYPRVLQVLFFESPTPAGDALRRRAVSAGVAPPERPQKLW